MYIVAIGWLYVVVLMALTEQSFAAGLATLLLCGVLPLGLIILVRSGSKRSRRLRREAIAQAEAADDSARPGRSMTRKEAPGDPDGADTQRDET